MEIAIGLLVHHQCFQKFWMCILDVLTNVFLCPSSAESAGIVFGTPTSSKIPGPGSVSLQQIGAFYSVVHGVQIAI